MGERMTPHELDLLSAATAKLVKSAVAESTAPLLARIMALESRGVVIGPQGPAGEKGIDGADGTVGPAGPQGPSGERGERGEVGPQGPAGDKGIDGLHGTHGKDGVGIAEAFIDHEHRLVLTLTDGTAKTLGVVVGRDGAPGQNGVDGTDGRDGFSLEDFGVEFDGERRLALTFERGDVRKSALLELPAILYRGVFTEGETYQRGDAVTWGGSLWIATDETTDKPEVTKSWRLAVKRGRDGREGKSGPQGPPGLKGDKGDR